MIIDDLTAYELTQRELARTSEPASEYEKLANAALELINNEDFIANPKRFVANEVTQKQLNTYHKNVITLVCRIHFRGIM